jgi:hypothetical protein
MTFQENRNIPSSHPGHGQGPAGASLSDILTAVKNVAVNIANLGQTMLAINGQQTAPALAAAALVKQGAGRVAFVNVTIAGAAPGSVIDANSVGATSPVLYVIPNVVGSTFVNLPYSFGLVVIPGTGQTVTVSYS